MARYENGLDLAEYRYDPVRFFRDILGIEPWSAQRDLIRAYRDHPNVAVRAGQKVSKTVTEAGIALHRATTFPAGKVVFFAPSDVQTRDILYAEILKRHEEARVPLGGKAHKAPAGGIRWADGRMIFGFSAAATKKKHLETFLGHSGDETLFLGDEASGITKEILETIDGNRGGGGAMFLGGNPTQNHGFFFDAFHIDRSRWCTKHIPSTRSPNVTGERRIRGCALPEYIEECRARWGEGSWRFQVKILGNFSKQSESSLFSLTRIEAARERWREQPSAEDLAEELRVGVDPARLGKDSTCIVLRRGRWSSRVVRYHQRDNVDVAGLVLQEIHQHARDGEYVRVKIDQSNNNGVADNLKRATPARGIRLGIVEVSGSDGSDDPQYQARRAEVYGSLNDWLETGAIPPEDTLVEELTAVRTSYTNELKLKLESKRELVARLGRSPDHADALALSTWEDQPDTCVAGDVEWDSGLIAARGRR